MDSFVNIVPTLDDDKFRQHFHLGRDTFELVLNAINKHVSNEFRCHAEVLPVQKEQAPEIVMPATRRTWSHFCAAHDSVTVHRERNTTNAAWIHVVAK